MEVTFESLGPGFHKNIPFKDYLKIKAFSKSMVGEIEKSPRHLKERLDNPITSSSLSLGSLVDCLLLEPETFKGTYVVAPKTYINSKDAVVKWDYRSKYCREWREEQEAIGKEVVTQDLLDEANNIVESITSKTAKKLLSGETQVTALWYDPMYGVPCKARYDVLNHNPDNITDLKTTSSNATSYAFAREALKYKYHVQAAAYLESFEQITGEPLKAFNFVVVETKAPYESGCFSLRADSIMLGQMEWERALGKYKECLDTGEYPGYPDALIELDLPAFALKPVEEGFVEDIIVEEN